MVKLDPVLGQNGLISEKIIKKALNQDINNGHAGDTVTISDEGKRKHIMGQLVARLTEQKG
ncbi:MAG: hypothetical protein HY893_00235 [Deltaproteobacteria bacterium]|nr:hypothetical protein [Deltaproteobacteria bacterium]